MKIAHIAPPWLAIPPKNYGGTENVLYNLIEEQVAQGHDVTLFAPGDAQTSAKLVSFFSQSLLAAGIPWQAHLKAFYHVFKSVEYIKEQDFDIVHSHLSSCADMYVFPLMAPLSVPHVTTLHSCFPFDRVEPWRGDADLNYLEWLAPVPMIAISESARDAVPHRLNFVGVVHHGMPLESFRPTVTEPDDYFVWLGRIVADKGTHHAIRAAREAGVRLILAGTVDEHVPETVRYFKEKIEPELDGEQIRYIGPVNMEQKRDLLSRARGFLNPIEWEEPFGMVMIEAMAVGCPVITFARGAAPEIVKHRTSGFLVHNVEEMIHYMSFVDSLDRRAIRAHVERFFSARAMAEKYTRMYKKVIATSQFLVRSSLTPLPTHPPLISPVSAAAVKTGEAVAVPLQTPRSARARLGAEPLL